MKTPDTPLKKFARDVSKPQEKLLKTIMEFTAANTLTDDHIADQKIELEQAVENQKGVVEDYNKKILLAQNKEDEAEDIFVIAQNPGKFVDTSDNNKSKQELEIDIENLKQEKGNQVTLLNKLKMKLAAIQNIFPKDPSLN